MIDADDSSPNEREPRVINFMHGHPAYWCPVCNHPHSLDGRWKWNGNYDKPTFGPAHPGARSSYLSYIDVRAGPYWLLKRHGVYKCYEFSGKEVPLQYGDKGYAEQQAKEYAHENDGAGWGVVERQRKAERRVYCHVHVTDGMIRILPDTPGPLGGKTIPLRPWVLNKEGNWGRVV